MLKRLPITLSPELNSLLAEWRKTKSEIQALDARELELRLKIIGQLSEKEEGQQTIPLPFDYNLEIDKPTYYNVDKLALEDLRGLCVKFNMSLLFVQLFRYKAEVVLSVYKNAIEPMRKMLKPAQVLEFDRTLAETITIKPGTPQLKLYKTGEKK